MANEIIFRCDKTNDIGGGHLIRCIALAEYIVNKKNQECIFVGTYENHEIFFDDDKFSIIKINEKEDFSLYKNRIPSNPAWIVVDNYQLDSTQEEKFKAIGAGLMAIDDKPNRKHVSDILIDQTLNRKEYEYKDYVNNDTRILTGTKYAMIRQQFRDLRSNVITKKNNISNILISLGLSETNNIIAEIIKGLNRINKKVKIILLAVSNNEYINDLIKASHHEITIFEPCKNISDLLSISDYVIGAAGNSSWERCCLGIPAGLIILADNQVDNARALENEGAADILGDVKDINSADIYNYFSSIIDDDSKLNKMSASAFELCDGLGVERIWNTMNECN